METDTLEEPLVREGRAPAPAAVTRGQALTDFANVFKAFIGANYLSVSFAFGSAGVVLGSVLLVIVAIVTDHCCSMIVVCKRKVRVRVCVCVCVGVGV